MQLKAFTPHLAISDRHSSSEFEFNAVREQMELKPMRQIKIMVSLQSIKDLAVPLPTY